jgi:hypothetical protein
VNDTMLLEETKKGYKLQEAIDHVLMVMSLSRYEPKIGNFVDEKFFRRAEPFILMDEFEQIRNSEMDNFYFSDAHLKDLEFGADVTTIGGLCTAEGCSGMVDYGCTHKKEASKAFAVSRVRSVNPKEVRGKIKWHMPEIVEYTNALYDAQMAKADTYKVLMGSTGNLEWHCLNTDVAENPDVDEMNSFIIQTSLGIQFTRRYQWTVELALGTYGSMLVPTDPTGARDVFKFRDIPSGSERRKALRHWVREHYRKRRVDEGDEIKVREHMRGATEFGWHDLNCRIRPSQFDIERDDTAKALREAEKIAMLARRK